MIKAIVFDLDGMVFLSKEMFSEKLSREYNIPKEKIIPFFKNELGLCQEGKIDTKETISKYLQAWGWKKGVDELFKYWFNDGELNKEMVELIKHLREKKVICLLCTNNEKYRLEFLMKKFKLNKIFDHVISSCYVGVRKPNKNMFDKVIEITKLKPNEIIFCDDKEEHIKELNKEGFIPHKYHNILEFKSLLYNSISN